eukprot:7628014-Alexandrium_andersonii.AAC.1
MRCSTHGCPRQSLDCLHPAGAPRRAVLVTAVCGGTSMRSSGAPSTSSGRTVNTHTTLAPPPLQEGAHLLTFGFPR